uniref:Uncharacterized protein n=1 Tax=Clastoptera arizonana TaxID=38151 RepID=A0A1B6DDY2_9HEMI
MKFRLKGKGNRWTKGHSSICNPTAQLHRKSAQNRFFQENLGLGTINGPGLTAAALKVLDNKSLSRASSVKDDAESWTDVESTVAKTFNSCDTFASDWSRCSNLSFNKLINNFRSDSALHKDMLAVLASTTEVIENQGGSGTNTEYYGAFITTLENIDCDESLLAATINLLSMGIKTVPREVLIATFSKSSRTLMSVMVKYADSEETMIIRSVIKCLQEVLRAQDATVWKDNSTLNIFETILTFTVHSKPKVRKDAQIAVCAILKYSTYITEHKLQPSVHPAASVAGNFCIRQIEKYSLVGSITTTLHVFSLLKDILCTFPKAQLKTACESVLKGMTLSNPVIVTCGLCVLETMFASHPHASSLTLQLNTQLIAALYDFQPSVTDAKSTIAWLKTLQAGFANLGILDFKLFMENMPRFFTTASSLWVSGNKEVTDQVSQSLVEIICNTIVKNYKQQYTPVLSKLIFILQEGLKDQYYLAWNSVVTLFGTIFHELGETCKDLLLPPLKLIAELRDSRNIMNNSVDDAIGNAVKSMGPQVVLEAVPLKITGSCADASEEFRRSWLIPILRANIRSSSIQCFMDAIHPLITASRNYAQKMEADNNQVGVVSYTLLETQLWSLLPAFCSQPSDITESFPKMAKGLGGLLSNRKDLRLIIMSSLRHLITYSKDNNRTNDVMEISRFAKNYLPILFNIFTTETKGSDEEGIRLASLQTIKVYLSISPEDLCKELYTKTKEKLESDDSKDDGFKNECLLDLLRVLIPYQPVPTIIDLFENKLEKLKCTNKHKIQKKYYRILEEIISSDTASCNEFAENKFEEIKTLLLDSLSTSAPNSRRPRLKCLLELMKRNELKAKEMLLNVVPEAVLCCCDINSSCRETAHKLLEMICDMMKDNLEVFIEIVMTGLNGQQQLATASILALSVTVKRYKELLNEEMITSLINNICLLLCSSSREITKAALGYLEMFVTSFDKDLVLSALPNIVKAISSMTQDCQNCFRLKTRDLLAKFERWFGAATVIPLIPTDDTILITRVQNLNKIYRRKKKQREAERQARMANKESIDGFEVKPKVKSFEDLLEDVYMSDLEINEKEALENKNKNKTRKNKNEVWLQEDDNDIVDFTNLSAAKKYFSNKSSVWKKQRNRENKQKSSKSWFQDSSRWSVNY